MENDYPGGFDARSVMLAISGLFFGAVPTIIAMTSGICCKFYGRGWYVDGC
jgi:hypothetical protein